MEFIVFILVVLLVLAFVYIRKLETERNALLNSLAPLFLASRKGKDTTETMLDFIDNLEAGTMVPEYNAALKLFSEKTGVRVWEDGSLLSFVSNEKAAERLASLIDRHVIYIKRMQVEYPKRR